MIYIYVLQSFIYIKIVCIYIKKKDIFITAKYRQPEWQGTYRNIRLMKTLLHKIRVLHF